jgi:hypothetical protein
LLFSIKFLKILSKGNYNSTKIEEKKIKICRNSRNCGYLSHALEMFNGSDFCFSFAVWRSNIADAFAYERRHSVYFNQFKEEKFKSTTLT